MAHIVADRVRETSTTTGTGSYTLAGAINGFRTVDSVADTGDTLDGFISMGANWEVGRYTFTSPTTLARTTIYASSNAGAAVSWAAGTKDVGLVPGAAAMASVPAYGGDHRLINGRIAIALSGSDLVVSVLTRSDDAPSAADPVFVVFQSVDFSVPPLIMALTAATTFTLTNGSSLGMVGSATLMSRLWFVGFNDGGTFRLGAINCATTGAGLAGLSEWAIASSTAEGGAGGADTAGVIYTGTAVTDKPMTILGFVDLELTAPGTWTGLAQLGPYNYRGGMPLPGDVVQRQRTVVTSASNVSGTTVLPVDNTVPQITEGIEMITCAIRPKGNANRFRIRANLVLGHTAGGQMGVALFQDATAGALAGVAERVDTAGTGVTIYIEHEMAVNVTAGTSTTFRIRAGCSAAGTTRLNSRDGTNNLFSTVCVSFLAVEEIMA
jgi:hypothetical protein